jgi:hypothetical protein
MQWNRTPAAASALLTDSSAAVPIVIVFFSLALGKERCSEQLG